MSTEIEFAESQTLSRQYPVTIQYQRRTSRFYSLTNAEIEMYANLGWATNILMALFGASGGFALGCAVALMQGGLPSAPYAALTSSAIVSGVSVILFLALAFGSILLQAKTRRQWEREPAIVDSERSNIATGTEPHTVKQIRG